MAYATARLSAAIDGANSATTHVQLHDGDPGAGGTANVAAESSRVAFTFPAGSSGSSSDTAQFTISGAGGPYGYVTGWNASSDGTYQWTAAISPAESFAGAGTLDVTITATAANS